MNNKPSLIRYPLFRLAVSMATGIFFFDRFLPDISVSCIIYLFLPLSVVLIILGLKKYRNNGLHYLFGSMVSVCFFLFGGVLVINERNDIEYQWNDDACMYYGKIVTPPEEKSKSLCSTVHIVSQIIEKDSLCISVNRDILLYCLKDSVNSIKCGDEILFYSKISEPVSDVEFMGFDYKRYLFTKGISGTTFVLPSGMFVVNDDDVSIKAKALQYRDSIVNVYSGWKLDDDNMAVVSAVTIGDKSGLTTEIKAMYSAAGASHVLALSGLHIGIFSAILYILLLPLKKIRNGNLLQSLIVVFVLWTFAFVSGLSPSVVRAVTMCSLYLLASLLVENGLSGLYSLTLTAFIMLLYQPLYLFDISFRLSFLAVLFIILFFPYFNSLVTSKNRILRYLWGMISVSLSAQLGTLPLILYYFGSFPTYFLLANLIVSPLAVCLLSLTLMSFLFMWIPYVGDACIYALNMSTGFLNSLMGYIYNMKGAQITSIHINEIQVIVMFAMIVCFYMYLQYRKHNLVITILFSLCILLGVGYYNKIIYKEQPVLFLAWSDLYLKCADNKTKLTSETGIHSVNGVNIGVMKNDYWKNKELKIGERPIQLDYVYFCRGFKGDLKSVAKIFKIEKIILDTSLSDYYRSMIKEQSKELNIPIYENSSQVSYKIVL